MSKKVFLRRREILNHLPKEVVAEAVSKLSSVYVNRQPLKGFSPEDEKKYMTGLLDVTPDHQDWPRHSKIFWSELSVPVTFIGVELEIGLDSNENPINLMDFLKYNFAIKHPHVALSEEEMIANGSKRFYIQDSKRDELKRFNEIQMRKDADKVFIKLSSDTKGMKRVLRLLSHNLNPDVLTLEQIENALYDIKTTAPKKFLRIAEDKNLETKAEIDEMITAGVLRKIGNQVIFIDEVLGETMDDTVIYLKNKKNSGKLTTLRAKLKEVAL
jgi:hypothetical protein|tara:strand:+ start:5763 stop:6575 length:813 start_codon:yes stop_codon:yes gene_type:complete